MSAKLERRQSKRLSGRESAAPYAKKEAGAGSTGLTSYMGDSSLDWEGDLGEAKRSESFVKRSLKSFGRGGKKCPPLPKNWKLVKEKDGAFGKEKVYYLNTVTNQRSHEPPPPLPKGWKEALHKDSGRVYYYNKETRETTFEFPGNGAAGEDMDDDDDDDSEVPEAPSEGFFGRAVSKMTGKGKKKGEGLDRSATLSTQAQTLKKQSPRSKGVAAPAATAAATEDGKGPVAQKTVFISCSQLITEVKLCVEQKFQAELDSLYEKLTAQQIPAEQAVKQLMELVGSTTVQQAGLSVMNTQKGTLPHGWLEYIDEASGRPYYFNVHTKVTTWYKPTGGPAPPPSLMNTESNDLTNIEFALETHTVAMTGFL